MGIGLSFGEQKNSSSEFESKLKPQNLNETNKSNPLSGLGGIKVDDDIAEQISDNYDDDFENESLGTDQKNKTDDFFKKDTQTKKVDKQSDPS